MKNSPIDGLTLSNIVSDGKGKLSLLNINGLKIDNVKNGEGDNAVSLSNVKLAE
jgi:hypothetical protein